MGVESNPHKLLFIAVFAVFAVFAVSAVVNCFFQDHSASVRTASAMSPHRPSSARLWAAASAS